MPGVEPLRLVAAILGIFVLAGCESETRTSHASYPATDPETVRIFQKGPRADYEVLGPVGDVEFGDLAGTYSNVSEVEEEMDADAKKASAVALISLRRQAGQLGAEGIILDEMQVFMPNPQNPMEHMKVRMTGTAIRFRREEMAASNPRSGAESIQSVPLSLFSVIPLESGRGLSPFSVMETPRAGSSGQRSGATVQLGAYTVEDYPLQGFGFNIRIRRDKSSHIVEEIAVITVLPDSPAEAAGLKPRDSITEIDGVPVQSLIGSLAQGTELNRKLMNRTMGDRLDLKVMRAGFATPKSLTLIEGREPGAKGKYSVNNFDYNPMTVHPAAQ